MPFQTIVPLSEPEWRQRDPEWRIQVKLGSGGRRVGFVAYRPQASDPARGLFIRAFRQDDGVLQAQAGAYEHSPPTLGEGVQYIRTMGAERTWNALVTGLAAEGAPVFGDIAREHKLRL